MTIKSLVPVFNQLTEGLKTYGLDLKSAFKFMNIQTVGIIAILVVLGVLLYDFFVGKKGGFGALLGGGVNEYAPYQPYSRNVLTAAANVWENHKDEFGFDAQGRNGKSIGVMTEVFDALAKAVLKYEGEDPTELNILAGDAAEVYGGDLHTSPTAQNRVIFQRRR